MAEEGGGRDMKRTPRAWLAAACLTLAATSAASAQDIKIGQTMPYSGPLSVLSTTGKAEAAYFAMINDQGGVKGHRIDFISVDDGYNPAKTVEQVRDLVEQRDVLLLFSTIGTGPNIAIQKYLNNHKIPQLFLASGADRWGDYKQFPWTMGWYPSYRVEARVYAQYILANRPAAKVAVLYQDDDFGKDYLTGLKDVFGAKTDQIEIATQGFAASQPTVGSQIISLRASGADTLVLVAGPKSAAQAIRKIAELGWTPLILMSNVSSSVSSVMKPAGPQNAVGIITAAYMKDPIDSRWSDDPGLKAYKAWMTKYFPAGQVGDVNNAVGYSLAQTMVQTLKQCGENFSRENVMRQAQHLNMTLPMLLPGITVNTGPANYHPIKQMQLARFDGTTWVLFGNVISGASGN